jgi:transcriptional regulator with XRE-family HTH domain
MRSMPRVAKQGGTRGRSAAPAGELGRRLRQERERAGMSLRKLASQLEISPSALSQIENARSQPSVSTLYAIVNELGISFDALFARGERDAAPAVPTDGERRDPGGRRRIVQPADERPVIELDSGVRWERLNPPGDANVEFLEVTYDVGGTSSGGNKFMRHAGSEYGVVLSGLLKVTVGFEDHELRPGDSISFESAVPHRLENVGDEPVRAIWFTVGG